MDCGRRPRSIARLSSPGISMRVEPYWDAGQDAKDAVRVGRHSIAGEAGLRLLIGGQAAEIHERDATDAEGRPTANGIRICDR